MSSLESLYLNCLTWMFLFWSSARILTYVPTILKLLRPDASARDYSLATWICWVMSNATFGLYLYEQSGRELNILALVNAGNTLMCLLTSILIFRLQRDAGRRPANSTDSRPPSVAAATMGTDR
jgi:hypothetical protein